LAELASHRLTLGTAGHIDHGKTALVAALTGTDTDRLEEERRRGISIELGFAELELGSGQTISVVDVPGHERLVRAMVAGATGIDLFLLVIAADDGVMPQTREHLAVLRALGVDSGVVAITKCDLADAEARAAAAGEGRALVPGAALIEVSARTGAGVEELRRVIAELAAGANMRPLESEAGEFVLHADRVFTLRGVGTVVTGTLQGGAVARGEVVRLLPVGLEARVRSVEVHGRGVEQASPGQRVALNLSGVVHSAIERGDAVTGAGAALTASYRLDVQLALEPGAGELGGKRVQVHHGTRTSAARVVVLDEAEDLAQLRLEAPVMARPGDRFVLRRIARPATLGGGSILDPTPRRHGPGAAVDRLRRIRDEGMETVLAAERQDAASASAPAASLRRPRELDRAALLVLALLRRDGAEPRSPRALAEATRLDQAAIDGALRALAEHGLAERAGGGVYFATEALEAMRTGALELAAESGELTLPGLRTSLGTSRKYAQAILESLDARGETVRHGDRHVVRRPRRKVARLDSAVNRP
jgi:selenocysteine-specific elongation factor